MTQPQIQETIFNENVSRVYLKGINSNLKPNDPLLIGIGSESPAFFRVTEVTEDADADRTLVTFRLPDGLITEAEDPQENLVDTVELIKELTLRPSLQPRNTLRLNRKLEDQFTAKAETGYRTVGSFSPQLRETLPLAAANAEVALDSDIKIHALRLTASLFGHNVPKRTRIQQDDGSIAVIGDWPIIEVLPGVNGDGQRIEHEKENTIYLGARHDGILAGSWVVIETPDTRLTDPNRIVVRAHGVDNSIQRSE